MRIALVVIASSAACGGGKQGPDGKAFLDGYVAVAGELREIADARAKGVAEGKFDDEGRVAHAIMIGHFTTGYSLPPAPAKLSACRDGAIEILDGLEDATMPLVGKVLASAPDAEITAAWAERRDDIDEGMCAMAKNWAVCVEGAKAAGLTHPMTELAFGCPP